MVTGRFATNSFRSIMKSFRCSVVSLHHKSIRCHRLFVLNRLNSATSGLEKREAKRFCSETTTHRKPVFRNKCPTLTAVLFWLLLCSFFGREYSFPLLKASRTHFTVLYRRISPAVALTAAGLYLFIIALYFPWTKRCIKSHVTCYALSWCLLSLRVLSFLSLCLFVCMFRTPFSPFLTPTPQRAQFYKSRRFSSA